MVSTVDATRDGAADVVPPPLSEGAGRALGSVLSRLLEGKPAKRTRSAPGLGLVLGADEELAEAAAEEANERTRDRDSKRARMAFEALARVVPDAATGAQSERRLREVATKGVVALFNAVSKAQKGAAMEQAPGKKKTGTISKEGFMNLIREGVSRGASREDGDASAEGEADALPGDCSSGDGGRPRATWMKDDYMTKGSRKLKDWNRDGDDGSSSDMEEIESKEQESDGVLESGASNDNLSTSESASEDEVESEDDVE